LPRDLLGKGFTGREVRCALLTVNYRLPLNFTIPGMEAARAALSRIDEWVERIAAHAGSAEAGTTDLAGFGEKFFAALDEDLNISGALGFLFDLVRESNSALDRGELAPGQAAQLLADWRQMDSVLGFEREAAAIPVSREIWALYSSTGSGASSTRHHPPPSNAPC